MISLEERCGRIFISTYTNSTGIVTSAIMWNHQVTSTCTCKVCLSGFLIQSESMSLVNIKAILSLQTISLLIRHYFEETLRDLSDYKNL